MPAGGLRARLIVLALVLITGFGVLAAAGQAVAIELALPAPSVISPRPSGLVASRFVLVGRVGPTVTEVRVTGANAATVAVSPADATGATFTVEVAVRYGRTVLELTAGDGARWSSPTRTTVWSLGRTPARARYVLVDKSDFMLYVVRSSSVVAAFPIATGMRGTPTPTGTFYLGSRVRSPNSVWGPFRMRLYRQRAVRVSYFVRVNGHRVRRWKTVVRRVAMAYYIHGTNAPDSIGTPASHGCVRMFNRDLRKFRPLVYRYEPTIIRR